MKDLIKIIISLVLFTLSFFFKDITIILLGISYGLISYEFYIETVKNILKGEIFDEKFLMIIATIGAFIIGESFEAVAVMLFYSIGEFLSNLAVNKSKDRIMNLMDLRADTATIVQDGKFIQVQPENVKIGDIILIKPGEKIPLDGVIVDGTTKLDTSSITGESKYIDATINSEVLSGYINNQTVIKVKVTKEFSESTVSKIIRLIEESEDKKSNTEKFITRFSKIYTPIVLLLALLIFIIPVLFGGSTSTWGYRALVLLVTSCPCALVLSVPLGFFCGIGLGSKNGILFKSTDVLDNIGNVKSICFDKTGTLTYGKFMVTNIIGQDDTLKYAAYAEYFSNHPISEAIKSKYKDELDKTLITDHKEVDGGIVSTVDSKQVIIGNKELLNSYGIEVTEVQDIGTVVYVAIDQKHIGTIIVKDTYKKEAIGLIKKLPVKSVMLSGDNVKVVSSIATTLDIEEYHGDLKPQDKLEYIKNHDYTMFVGDGVNDAPAIYEAYIGVSMGGVGSDAALEASDIIIMTDDISNVSKLFSISKVTKNKIKQNIIFALFVKIIVLVLGALGISNILMAVFADIGVTILTVLNATTIMFRKFK